jgi:hypothetical protein
MPLGDGQRIVNQTRVPKCQSLSVVGYLGKVDRLFDLVYERANDRKRRAARNEKRDETTTLSTTLAQLRVAASA